MSYYGGMDTCGYCDGEVKFPVMFVFHSVVLCRHGWSLLLHSHPAGFTHWLRPLLEWILGGEDGGRQFSLLVCRYGDSVPMRLNIWMETWWVTIRQELFHLTVMDLNNTWNVFKRTWSRKWKTWSLLRAVFQSARHMYNEVTLCVHSPAVGHSTELLVVSGVSGPVLRLLHPLWWLHWEQGLHQHQHAPLCRRLCVVHPASDPGSHHFSFTFIFEQECAWLSWIQGIQPWVALSGWSEVCANVWTVINLNLRNFDVITGDYHWDISWSILISFKKKKKMSE